MEDGGAGLSVLVADGDAGGRSLLAALARERVAEIVVIEAADGAEAVRIALQRRPPIALLDVVLPRLGGIEAATTVRALQPQMRLALQADDTAAHRGYAREHRLPLFDKRDLDRALDWVELQARTWLELHLRRDGLRGPSLECAECGYGVARRTPPERCPMCQSVDSWIYGPWRPFRSERRIAC